MWAGFWSCLVCPFFICFPQRMERTLYSPPNDISSLNSKEQRCQDLSVTWLTILWELARQFISPISYSQKLWNYFVWNTWGKEGRLNSDNFIKYSVHLTSCYQQQKYGLIMISLTGIIYNTSVWKNRSEYFLAPCGKIHTFHPPRKVRQGTINSHNSLSSGFSVPSHLSKLRFMCYFAAVSVVDFPPLQGYRWISSDRKRYPSSQTERFIKLLIKVWVRA